MTADEMRISLLQEVATILDDEKLVKKALASLRRMKKAAIAKEDEDREPTKEEILAGIKEGLLEIKAAREGGYQLKSAREFLNEL